MQTIYLHPQTPQPRLLEQICQALQDGKVVAYPTNIGYALLTHPDAKHTLERLKTIAQLDEQEIFSLLCQDMSHASDYANIDNQQFKFIKNHQDGAVRFILSATKNTPKYLTHPKNKNIGIQFANTALLQALLNTAQTALVIHSFLATDDFAINAPYDIEDVLEQHIDILVNVDVIEHDELSIVNLTQDTPVVIKHGTHQFE